VALVGGLPPLGDGRIGFTTMPTEQYHEPPSELADDVRTYARVCTSLIEEAEAINWYAQRLAIERDEQAAAIMRDAQDEEFKHFSMDLEYLLRRTPIWREVAQRVLFQPGDIVENGEAAEAAVEPGADDGGGVAPAADSLGIGSLKGRER
jgi:uncharacterized protein